MDWSRIGNKHTKKLVHKFKMLKERALSIFTNTVNMSKFMPITGFVQDLSANSLDLIA